MTVAQVVPVFLCSKFHRGFVLINTTSGINSPFIEHWRDSNKRLRHFL